MPNEDRYQTATQIGEIGVNLVATQLILKSRGRLSPFNPMADDGRINLIIHDKETGRSFAIQVISRTETVLRDGKRSNNLHFEVPDATFNPIRDGYLLAIYFEPFSEQNDVKRAWIVPMTELTEVMTEYESANKIFRMRPNYTAESKDNFTGYRYKGLREVCSKLIRRFDIGT